MAYTFRILSVLGVVLSVLAASPALAQLNAGDPCPEPTPSRIFTQEGAAGPALVCNGTTLEVYESIKTGPMRKGVGTASPAAMLDVAGEAKIGNTSLACSATTEGAMRYNSTSKEMEYCNGTAWGSLAPAAGSGGCFGSPGTICSDETILAGVVCDTAYLTGSSGNCVLIYVPPADQAYTSQWGTYGYITGATSTTNGPGNQTNVYAHVMAGDGSYNPDDGYTPNAFVLCHNLSFGGHSDWYLPAKDELRTIIANYVAIGGFSSGLYYWSSSETNANYVWVERPSDGNQSTLYKYNGYAVRCARRG